MVFFFVHDTATTEIYTYGHSFPTRRSSDLIAGPACRPDRPSCRGRSGHDIPASGRPAGRAGSAPAGRDWRPDDRARDRRSEEHTSELPSLMRLSYAVFCQKKKKKPTYITPDTISTPTETSNTTNYPT